jgi:hypothetical protein
MEERTPADAGEGAKAPIENPQIPLPPDDPLRQPRPDEPGVDGDGEAAPPENPAPRE